ncbi:MAG: hypothetical protein AAFY56_23345, partial [Pseudomonadota bacterium]
HAAALNLSHEPPTKVTMSNINRLFLAALLIAPIGHAFSQSSPKESFDDWRAAWCDRPPVPASDELNLEVALRIESQVSQISNVALKSEPVPLRAEGYTRYYAISENGDNEIHGRWIGATWCDDQSEIQFVNFSRLPVVLDGGCGVISLVWNTESQTLTYLACNGAA